MISFQPNRQIYQNGGPKETPPVPQMQEQELTDEDIQNAINAADQLIAEHPVITSDPDYPQLESALATLKSINSRLENTDQLAVIERRQRQQVGKTFIDLLKVFEQRTGSESKEKSDSVVLARSKMFAGLKQGYNEKPGNKEYCAKTAANYLNDPNNNFNKYIAEGTKLTLQHQFQDKYHIYTAAFSNKKWEVSAI
jgi:hypothetical protein